jgi:hypothetical protein
MGVKFYNFFRRHPDDWVNWSGIYLCEDTFNCFILYLPCPLKYWRTDDGFRDIYNGNLEFRLNWVKFLRDMVTFVDSYQHENWHSIPEAQKWCKNEIELVKFEKQVDEEYRKSVADVKKHVKRSCRQKKSLGLLRFNAHCEYTSNLLCEMRS